MVDTNIMNSTPGLTAEQAREILRKRKAAYDTLSGFARYVDIPGVPIGDSDTTYSVVETDLARHHIIMMDTMQAIIESKLYYREVDGELVHCDRYDYGAKRCSRGMMMLPPGSAKSTYGSVLAPAWCMGKYPGTEIILTGYGDVITKRHGKRSRQLVSSDSYQAVFDTTLDPGLKAADDWSLMNGSSYKAAGILSGITGFRCDGLIWDDLTKGRKEADSFTIRNDTWNAYLDDARSRKKPDAWEIGIGTRWHEDETMGRILPAGYAGENGFIKCRDGNVWFIICIPAQAERTDDPLGREIGEYIWPEWFGEEYWNDKKLNPRTWASLYQQRPAPDDGAYFKTENFKRYDSLPDKLNHYISFDPAVTEQEDADDTAIHVWGIDQYGRIFLIDEWVMKATMDIWIAQLLAWIKIYKPMEVISESGVIRRASEPFIKRAMISTQTYATFHYVTRHSDKQAMARAAQAMYATGMIFHPRGTIGDRMEDELLRFPAAKADHRVDSVANLCLRLENIWASNAPMPPEENSHIIGGEGIKISSLMPERFPRKKSRWNKKRFS